MAGYTCLMNKVVVFISILTLSFFTTFTYAANIVPPIWQVLPQPEKIGDRFGGFSRSEAVEHCAREGLRLPAIRELAAWGLLHGSLIRESVNKAHANSLEVDLMRRAGFRAVYLHRTHMQTVVDFYYNSSKHNIPPGTGLGRFPIWTSDIRHVDGVDGYKFFAGSGMFVPSNSMRNHAVSCVPHNFMLETVQVEP